MTPDKCLLAFLMAGYFMPLVGQRMDKYVNPTVVINIVHAPKLDRRPKKIDIASSLKPDFDKKILLAIDQAMKNREETGFPITVQSSSEPAKNMSSIEKAAEQITQVISPESKDSSVLVSINPEKLFVIEDEKSSSKLDRGVSIFDKLKKVVRWGQFINSPQSSLERIFFNLRVTNLSSGQVLINQNYNSLLDEIFFRPPDRQAASTLTEFQIETLAGAVVSLLMGWVERVPFLYFDDRNYGMLLAYKLISVEDFAGATAQSLLNLEEGNKDPMVTPKNLAKLHYNLAIALLSTKDFSGATNHLREAVRIDPSMNIYLETLEKSIRYEKYAN